MSSPSPEDKLRCRLITDADLDAVAALLTEGFGKRERERWRCGLERLREREVPEGRPRYGYCLLAGSRLVGVILVISSLRERDGAAMPVANVASWYVQPEYRAYAQMLVSMALKQRDITYVNISAAPHTWPIVEKQGYSKYCNGLFVSFAALTPPQPGVEIITVRARGEVPEAVRQLPDLPLLQRHAGWGCESLVLRTGSALYPVVLRRFTIRKGQLRFPAMYVLHAPQRDALVRCCGNLGRHFLRRAAPILMFDATSAVAGLPGFYTERRGCKFFKGPNPPALCDLADTEFAIFGF